MAMLSYAVVGSVLGLVAIVVIGWLAKTYPAKETKCNCEFHHKD